MNVHNVSCLSEDQLLRRILCGEMTIHQDSQNICLADNHFF